MSAADLQRTALADDFRTQEQAQKSEGGAAGAALRAMTAPRTNRGRSLQARAAVVKTARQTSAQTPASNCMSPPNSVGVSVRFAIAVSPGPRKSP